MMHFNDLMKNIEPKTFDFTKMGTIESEPYMDTVPSSRSVFEKKTKAPHRQFLNYKTEKQEAAEEPRWMPTREVFVPSLRTSMDAPLESNLSDSEANDESSSTSYSCTPRSSSPHTSAPRSSKSYATYKTKNSTRPKAKGSGRDSRVVIMETNSVKGVINTKSTDTSVSTYIFAKTIKPSFTDDKGNNVYIDDLEVDFNSRPKSNKVILEKYRSHIEPNERDEHTQLFRQKKSELYKKYQDYASHMANIAARNYADNEIMSKRVSHARPW